MSLLNHLRTAIGLPLAPVNSGVEYSADLIAMYQEFQDRIHKPKSVFYPSCGFDGSPARVFENVVFLDKEEGNPGCITALQGEGYVALKQDVATYSPSTLHDLVILLNPAIPYALATKHLDTRGFVLANDWHRTATAMHADDSFELIGSLWYKKEEETDANPRARFWKDTSQLFVRPDVSTLSFDEREEVATMERLGGPIRYTICPNYYVFQKK